MTDIPAPPDADALSIVREIIRRSGHEIRNSLNGVSVNMEVVRSRIGPGGGQAGSGEVRSFAERASKEITTASQLTDAALALVDAVLRAEASGSLRAASGHGAPSGIELMIYGDGAPSFVSGVSYLAKAIGVRVEQRGQSVILRVLPEDKSHSKN